MPQLLSPRSGAPATATAAHAPQQEKPLQREAHTPKFERSTPLTHEATRPSAAKEELGSNPLQSQNFIDRNKATRLCRLSNESPALSADLPAGISAPQLFLCAPLHCGLASPIPASLWRGHRTSQTDAFPSSRVPYKKLAILGNHSSSVLTPIPPCPALSSAGETERQG